MPNIKMRSKDAIAAKHGSCYITMDGNRYLLMQAKDIEAKCEKHKQTVPRMGDMMDGHIATGMEGKGSATFYYNTSIFRKAMEHYKDTGEDIYFDMELINDSPTSQAKSQVVVLKDCNFDSVILAKIASDDSILEDSFDFTFDDWNLAKVFDNLDGML